MTSRFFLSYALYFRSIGAAFHFSTIYLMKNNRISVLILTAGYLLGLIPVLFPLISNLIHMQSANQQIVQYDASVSLFSGADLEALYREAAAYNETLFLSGSTEGYEDLLNFDGSGMMGYIVIPEIDVNLPIYHGTGEDTLKAGAGHLKSSSLPVGGDSAHCVITGHSGFPGSRLFTRLDEIESGDLFYIHVLGETLAYEVTQIRVVLPEETQSLAIREGEDLCTLVTCTPYGVNSHRLLVTGRRTEYVPAESAEEEASVLIGMYEGIAIITAGAETIIYVYARRRMTGRKKSDSESKEEGRRM